MPEIDIVRTNPGVDPALHVWGWEIPVYLFLGGISAGVMILSPLLAERVPERSRTARLLPFVPAVALSLGMLALFLDLANKAHVYRFYLAFRPASPMSWGAWILVLVYPVTLLSGLAGLTEPDAGALSLRLGPLRWPVERLRRWGQARAQGLGQASRVLGVALGVYTGILLGTLGARAAWSSPVLGPLFLASGVSTGAALLLLLPLSGEEHRLVAAWDLKAIGLELALLALFVVGLGTGDLAGSEAARALLSGRFAGPFFALVLGAGLLVPLTLGIVEARGAGHAGSRLGPALVLGGGLALRWVLVLAGQA